jgi:predicted nucleotidyltransferase component of viral defense system
VLRAGPVCSLAVCLRQCRDALLADLKIPVVSLEDTYGGKLVAAMGRQHPRDLFDVMQLFAHEASPLRSDALSSSTWPATTDRSTRCCSLRRGTSSRTTHTTARA